MLMNRPRGKIYDGSGGLFISFSVGEEGGKFVLTNQSLMALLFGDFFLIPFMRKNEFGDRVMGGAEGMLDIPFFSEFYSLLRECHFTYYITGKRGKITIFIESVYLGFLSKVILFEDESKLFEELGKLAEKHQSE